MNEGARSPQPRKPATVWYAAIWLSLGVVAYLIMEPIVSPRIAHPVVTSDGNGIVVIERSRDQHFYVEGSVNGYPVTFLVDTGASLVSVSDELARKIGLPQGVPAIFNTASGQVAGQIVPDASVRVGSIRVDGIRVGVGVSGSNALLGQNFLNKVQLTQERDSMVLRIGAHLSSAL